MSKPTLGREDGGYVGGRVGGREREGRRGIEGGNGGREEGRKGGRGEREDGERGQRERRYVLACN